MTMELENIYNQFKKESDVIDLFEKLLWSNNPICPYCKTSFYSPVKNTDRYHCNKCNTSYSITVNTMFHKTKVDLRKWIYLMYILSLGRDIPSLRKLAEELQITKDTVSKIINRIKQHYLSDKEFIDNILNNLHND